MNIKFTKINKNSVEKKLYQLKKYKFQKKKMEIEKKEKEVIFFFVGY
jgi:hypothetical protein